MEFGINHSSMRENEITRRLFVVTKRLLISSPNDFVRIDIKNITSEKGEKLIQAFNHTILSSKLLRKMTNTVQFLVEKIPERFCVHKRLREDLFQLLTIALELQLTMPLEIRSISLFSLSTKTVDSQRYYSIYWLNSRRNHRKRPHNIMI